MLWEPHSGYPLAAMRRSSPVSAQAERAGTIAAGGYGRNGSAPVERGLSLSELQRARILAAMSSLVSRDGSSEPP